MGLGGKIALLLLLPVCSCSILFSPDGDGNPAAADADLADRTAAADATTTADARGDGLIDRGILARYFIDEAGVGQGPVNLVDSQSPPANLPISYDGVVAFAEVNDNRGLEWNGAGQRGEAELNTTASPKFSGLSTTELTIELVVDIEAVPVDGGNINGAVLIAHHDGTDGMVYGVTLRTSGSLELYFNRLLAGSWQTSLVGGSRAVVHVVVNSELVEPAQQLRVLIDGVAAAPLMVLIQSDARASGGADEHFVLGNSNGDNNSFDGRLFYAAVYTAALDQSEISQNTARLSASDDR